MATGGNSHGDAVSVALSSVVADGLRAAQPDAAQPDDVCPGHVWLGDLWLGADDGARWAPGTGGYGGVGG